MKEPKVNWLFQKNKLFFVRNSIFLFLAFSFLTCSPENSILSVSPEIQALPFAVPLSISPSTIPLNGNNLQLVRVQLSKQSQGLEDKELSIFFQNYAVASHPFYFSTVPISKGATSLTFAVQARGKGSTQLTVSIQGYKAFATILVW